MENKEFAVYKYGSGANKKNLMIVAAVASLFITVMLASSVSIFCLVILVLPAWIIYLIIKGKYDSSILLANRYIILEDKIIYFRNVEKAILNRNAQTLTITSGNGKSAVVEADKFPTNARKADKIKNNKTAKFSKVSEKIIAKLRETSPEIVVS